MTFLRADAGDPLGCCDGFHLHGFGAWRNLSNQLVTSLCTNWFHLSGDWPWCLFQSGFHRSANALEASYPSPFMVCWKSWSPTCDFSTAQTPNVPIRPWNIHPTPIHRPTTLIDFHKASSCRLHIRMSPRSHLLRGSLIADGHQARLCSPRTQDMACSLGARAMHCARSRGPDCQVQANPSEDHQKGKLSRGRSHHS